MQAWRNIEAVRFGGLEIDDQLELRRLLEGEIARFGPLQDLIHVRRGAPVNVDHLGSVGHEAAGVRKFPQVSDQRQPIAGREVHDLFSVTKEHGVGQHEDSTGALCLHRGEGTRELSGIPHIERLEPQPQQAGRRLCLSQLRFGDGIPGIPENSHPRSLRKDRS